MMAEEFRAVNWQGLTLAELEQRVIEIAPALISLWKAYLNSTSEEPTEQQRQAGFVELIDMASFTCIDDACTAIEPYEGVLYRYAELRQNRKDILNHWSSYLTTKEHPET